jgi:hypothetical protein
MAANPSTKQADIVRPVELIFGMRNIAKALRIDKECLKECINAGAPLYRRGKRGDLFCEKAELWQWYKENHAATPRVA